MYPNVCDGFRNGFVVASSIDGKILAWGRNELGQLGNASREPRSKPRFNTGFSHRILQVSAGSEHVVALSTTGSVLTWGGNRKGQLGDGLFTSRNTPAEVRELRHRPITSIACGDSHSMALTVGGAIYTWGDNRLVLSGQVSCI
jgi:alpha-tubulin suppressor-like RCC1 family protein